MGTSSNTSLYRHHSPPPPLPLPFPFPFLTPPPFPPPMPNWHLRTPLSPTTTLHWHCLLYCCCSLEDIIILVTIGFVCSPLLLDVIIIFFNLSLVWIVFSSKISPASSKLIGDQIHISDQWGGGVLQILAMHGWILPFCVSLLFHNKFLSIHSLTFPPIFSC